MKPIYDTLEQNKPTTVYGQWNNIYICHEKLRFSVFKVNKVRGSFLSNDENTLKIVYPLAYIQCAAGVLFPLNSAHASAPDTFKEDPPISQFNAKMFRILMSPDMYLYSGWQYLYANDTSNTLGKRVFVTALDMPPEPGGKRRGQGISDVVFTLSDMYRKYCRYDFGK